MHLKLWLLAFCLLSPLLSQEVTARDALPIMDENGRSIGLYRRVISKPGIVVRESAGSGPTVESPVPFSTYYVFDETRNQQAAYLQVGPPGRSPSGWVSASDVLEWPNNLTLLFSPRVTRYRVPFFRSLPSISAYAAGQSELAKRTRELLDEIDRGASSPFSSIVAGEAEQYVDWQEKFYLMPVMQFVEPSNVDQTGLLMRTSAIPLTIGNDGAGCDSKPNAGVVFVLDTTKSMGPYIERSVQMVQKMSRAIEAQALAERVAFGLVAFRDNPEGRTGVDYRSKVFLNLSANSDAAALSGALKQATAAKGSTKGFSEDALAGLLDALAMDWSEYQSRWVVLVTDASPQPTTQDASGAVHDVGSVGADLWESKQIGAVSIHLKTPEAGRKRDLRKAERLLKTISKWDNVNTPYYAVDNGDVDAFGGLIDALTQDILLQIGKSTEQLKSASGQGDPLADVGLAQRVIWLGRCSGQPAPPVVDGWVMQRAVNATQANNSSSSQKDALEPRVLITRQQLDQLTRSIVMIREAARSAPELDGNAFFDAVAAQLANASIDPSRLSATGKTYVSVKDWMTAEVKQLGDLLPGFLSRIPFKPDFLTVSRDTWNRLSASERQRLLLNLDQRVATLKAVYNNNRLWVGLHPQSDPSEYVTPLLLKRLP